MLSLPALDRAVAEILHRIGSGLGVGGTEGTAGRTNLYPQIRYFGSAASDPHTDDKTPPPYSLRELCQRAGPDGQIAIADYEDVGASSWTPTRR